MSTTALLSTLNIFVLVVVASVLLAFLLLFLRKRGNRHPIQHSTDETQTPTDPM